MPGKLRIVRMVMGEKHTIKGKQAEKINDKRYHKRGHQGNFVFIR